MMAELECLVEDTAGGWASPRLRQPLIQVGTRWSGVLGRATSCW